MGWGDDSSSDGSLIKSQLILVVCLSHYYAQENPPSIFDKMYRLALINMIPIFYLYSTTRKH